METNKNFVISYVDDVKKYGATKALIIGLVKGWCKTNKNKKGYVHDGFSWSGHISIEELSENTGLKLDTAATNLKWLVDNGVLIKGNYNKVRYDRTGWYRPNPEIPDSHLGLNQICISGKTLNAFSVKPDIDLGLNPITIPNIQLNIRPKTQLLNIQPKIQKNNLIEVIDIIWIKFEKELANIIQSKVEGGMLTSKQKDVLNERKEYIFKTLPILEEYIN
jgi:hypothetical protein